MGLWIVGWSYLLFAVLWDSSLIGVDQIHWQTHHLIVNIALLLFCCCVVGGCVQRNLARYYCYTTEPSINSHQNKIYYNLRSPSCYFPSTAHRTVLVPPRTADRTVAVSTTVPRPSPDRIAVVWSSKDHLSGSLPPLRVAWTRMRTGRQVSTEINRKRMAAGAVHQKSLWIWCEVPAIKALQVQWKTISSECHFHLFSCFEKKKFMWVHLLWVNCESNRIDLYHLDQISHGF